MTADRVLGLPEQLPPFFRGVLEKAVEVSEQGFFQVDRLGRTAITATTSPKFTFVVEMYRDSRDDEIFHDYCKVQARLPGQVEGKPIHSFFVDRDREHGVIEAKISYGWGADNDPVNSEEENEFLREFLSSQVDLDLTMELFEKAVADDLLLSVWWPAQGLDDIDFFHII